MRAAIYLALVPVALSGACHTAPRAPMTATTGQPESTWQLNMESSDQVWIMDSHLTIEDCATEARQARRFNHNAEFICQDIKAKGESAQ